MCLWHEEFRDSQRPNNTVQDLIHLLDEPPFMENGDIIHIRDRLRAFDGATRDKKWCMLAGNGFFSVKSLYNYLNDGGLRCLVTKFFLPNWCPRKINLFNWLVSKNKILPLENLGH